MAGNKEKGDIMKNPLQDLEKYRYFLESIPLTDIEKN